MKRLITLAFLLCGCTGARTNVQQFPTANVRAAVESATRATQNATQRAAAARVSLRLAVAKSQELLTVASPGERPLVMQLDAALEQTQTELNATQEQLKTADGALADSADQLTTVQKQLCATDAELAKSREKVNGLEASREFWRASAWRLALLALALGLWTFRKPLLALCGGPIL